MGSEEDVPTVRRTFDMDTLMMQLGRWGPWQITAYVVVATAANLTITWHLFLQTFTGALGDHTCALGPYTMAALIPWDNDTDGYIDCERFATDPSGRVDRSRRIPCPDNPFPAYGPQKYYFYDNITETDVGSEFELMCERELELTHIQAYLFAGAILSAVTYCALPDIIGRTTVFCFSCIALAAIGVGQAFAPTHLIYSVCQGLRGFFMVAIFTTGITYVSELFPADQRIRFTIMATMFWTIGSCSLAGIAYAVRRWRDLTIMVSAPLFVFGVVFFVLPESVPWLITTGRIARAKRTLHWAGKVNRRTLNLGVLEDMELTTSGQGAKLNTNYTNPLAIFYAPVMRRYTFSICFIMFALNLAFFGLSFSSSNLTDNYYLSFFLVSVVEVPGVLIALFVVPRFGRVAPMAVCCLFGTLCLGVTVILLATPISDDTKDFLFALFGVIGKGGFTLTYTNGQFYLPEIFPTTHRNLGTAIAFTVGAAAALVAPYLVINVATLDAVWWLPSVLMTVLGVGATIALVFMPETAGRPLPDTIEDVQGWKLTVTKEEKIAYKASLASKRRDSKILLSEIPSNARLNISIDPLAVAAANMQNGNPPARVGGRQRQRGGLASLSDLQGLSNHDVIKEENEDTNTETQETAENDTRPDHRPAFYLQTQL